MVHAATEYNQVQTDWFPANCVKLLLEENPALIWLERFGHLSSFQPDKSEYRSSDSIFIESREFKKTWCEHHCPSVVRVCSEADEVRSAKKVRETFALMIRGVPVIGQAALWWAPEHVYGIADLLVHSIWLNELFPGLMTPAEAAKPAPNLGDAETKGHYVVVEFRTELEEPKNREVHAAQVRLYSYMLGQLQGVMPTAAYVITRDKVSQPFEVPIRSKVAEPLDGDLASLRDQFANKAQRAKYFALAS
ncbi:MAG: hypothetical protein LAO56_23800 [Acidobacteriia bacterium]|nr:hypothetical protein [Terriglobia bacterium]